MRVIIQAYALITVLVGMPDSVRQEVGLLNGVTIADATIGYDIIARRTITSD